MLSKDEFIKYLKKSQLYLEDAWSKQFVRVYTLTDDGTLWFECTDDSSRFTSEYTVDELYEDYTKYESYFHFGLVKGKRYV